MKGTTASDSIRVWSVGCATGEEAYSVAMLLLEQAGRLAGAPHIGIFASDLHEPSLRQAREGLSRIRSKPMCPRSAPQTIFREGRQQLSHPSVSRFSTPETDFGLRKGGFLAHRSA
ncbi:CheR family methyltransferase [Methylocystis echinoides]|uniref:CheR family methyltransferase n=1 Tax=Methylocystis echinoides TaxID=29468 RepID=UPI00343FE292